MHTTFNCSVPNTLGNGLRHGTITVKKVKFGLRIYYYVEDRPQISYQELITYKNKHTTKYKVAVKCALSVTSKIILLKLNETFLYKQDWFSLYLRKSQ